jgi:hypothetical protein
LQRRQSCGHASACVTPKATDRNETFRIAVSQNLPIPSPSKAIRTLIKINDVFCQKDHHEGRKGA